MLLVKGSQYTLASKIHRFTSLGERTLGYAMASVCLGRGQRSPQ